MESRVSQMESTVNTTVSKVKETKSKVTKTISVEVEMVPSVIEIESQAGITMPKEITIISMGRETQSWAILTESREKTTESLDI